MAANSVPSDFTCARSSTVARVFGSPSTANVAAMRILSGAPLAASSRGASGGGLRPQSFEEGAAALRVLVGCRLARRCGLGGRGGGRSLREPERELPGGPPERLRIARRAQRQRGAEEASEGTRGEEALVAEAAGVAA